jgi:hypothetical protein
MDASPAHAGRLLHFTDSVYPVESEGESTVHSTTLAGEIMRRMGLNSAIVVSDGYHIYRVKKMLESRGLKA